MANLTLALAMSLDYAVISMHGNIRKSESFNMISVMLGWKLEYGSVPVNLEEGRPEGLQSRRDKGHRMTARDEVRLKVPAHVGGGAPSRVSGE